MRSLLQDFSRARRGALCPVCGKPDWCLVRLSASGVPDAAICQRIESPHLWGEAGWFHRLADAGAPWKRRSEVRRIAVSDPISADLDALAHRCSAQAVPGAIRDLAVELGVTPESLRRLAVGWDGEAWTFPMSNRKGQVIGIRRRLPSGRKLSVKGGREGLFIPEGVDSHGQLLICEGPTDTAALLDLGFHAIGRPSCSGGTKHLVRFVRAERPKAVVVVADQGAPGQRGAMRLAAALRSVCKTVKVITPPGEAGDAREWVATGASTASVQDVIGRATALDCSNLQASGRAL